MSASDECDYNSFQFSSQSMSTVCSMELVDTLQSSLCSKCKVHQPKDSKCLFEIPSDPQTNAYRQLYPRVLDIIQELEETLPKVSIRDDYSLQPKAVCLRVPLKRNTLVS